MQPGRRHNLSQLRYFRSLSLRARLEAVEGMADVIRHFEKMRTSGHFQEKKGRFFQEKKGRFAV